MGAIYSAKFSGSPIIITAGQYEVGYGLQEPLLYEPLVPMVAPLVKWAFEVTRLEDLPRIVIGQRALVRIDAYPGRLFEARVAEITPRGDPISRSYRVRLALDKSESLSIGMTAEINVVIAERKNALLIPTTALRDDTVWVMNGEKAAKRSLRLGVKSPDKTEVLSGLSDTDVVISQPPADLSERSRLQRIVKP